MVSCLPFFLKVAFFSSLPLRRCCWRPRQRPSIATLLSIEFLASSPRTDIDNTSFRVFLLQSFLKALIFFFHPFFLKQKVPPPLLTVIASGEEGKAMVARESQSSMPIQSFAAVVGILTNNCYL